MANTGVVNVKSTLLWQPEKKKLRDTVLYAQNQAIIRRIARLIKFVFIANREIVINEVFALTISN